MRDGCWSDFRTAKSHWTTPRCAGSGAACEGIRAATAQRLDREADVGHGPDERQSPQDVAREPPLPTTRAVPVHNASTLGPLPIRPLAEVDVPDLAHVWRTNTSATVPAEVDATLDASPVVVHVAHHLEDGDRVVELRSAPDAARALLDASAGDVVRVIAVGTTVTRASRASA